MNPNQPAQPPQKLIDFNEELKALCKKYQYEIRAVLQFDPVRGLFPMLEAADMVPQEPGIILNKAEETKKNEDMPSEGVDLNSSPITPETATDIVDKPATN